MKTPRRTSQTDATRRLSRKATYSLPANLLDQIDRASGSARAKSGIVAEALTLYFVRQERLDLEAEFRDAAACQ